MGGLVRKILGFLDGHNEEKVGLGLHQRQQEPTLERRVLVSRRAFVAGGIAALGLLGVSAGEYFFRPQDIELPQYEAHTYASGQSIDTPLGKIRIKGWKVLFDIEAVRALVEQGLEFEVIATGDKKGFRGRFSGGVQNSPQYEISDLFGRPKNNVLPATVSGDGSEWVYFNTVPNINSNYITLKFMVYRNGKNQGTDNANGEVFSYRIKPIVNYYKPEDEKDFVRIFTEKELPQDGLKPIHGLHRLFSQYHEPFRVYVVDEQPFYLTGAQGPSTELAFNLSPNLKDMSILTTGDFETPFFKREGEIAACHEMAHNLFDYRSIWDFIGRFNPEVKAKTDFANLFNKAKYDPRIYPKDVFDIFTESAYFGNSRFGAHSVAGHPYDDESELFASAVCVLRYFRKEFYQRKSGLGAEERELVGRIEQATYKVFTSINKDPHLLAQMFTKKLEDIQLSDNKVEK